MVQIELNYVAVGVASLVHFGIGGLWYSPLLFANHWVKALGFTQADMEAGKSKMGRTMGLTFVVSLLTSFLLAHVLAATQSATILEGVKVVFEVWLAFIAAPQFLTFLYEKRSWITCVINCGYHLVALLVIGVLLVLWT